MMMAISVVFKCTTSYLVLGVTQDYLSQKNGNQPTTSPCDQRWPQKTLERIYSSHQVKLVLATNSV
jgi:hypothetical protein